MSANKNGGAVHGRSASMKLNLSRKMTLRQRIRATLLKWLALE